MQFLEAIINTENQTAGDNETSLTCRDLMKVHSRFRIPSDLFRSFTRRMTRNSLKKVIDTLMFSDAFSDKRQMKPNN